MPALSYKGRFVEYVEAGLQKPRPKGKRIKRQTVRNNRTRPIKPGDTLYHYFAQRSKWCRKLGESICKKEFGVFISNNQVTLYDRLPNGRLKFNRSYKTLRDLNRFAYADGFANWETMKRWWLHKLTVTIAFHSRVN